MRPAEQIVRDAIRRSEGAVIFYEGLKGFAQNLESRRMIDKHDPRGESPYPICCPAPGSDALGAFGGRDRRSPALSTEAADCLDN